MLLSRGSSKVPVRIEEELGKEAEELEETPSTELDDEDCDELDEAIVVELEDDCEMELEEDTEELDMACDEELAPSP